MSRDNNYEDARNTWIRLDHATRREIIKNAFKRKPVPDPSLADCVLGWAWAVLGPPWQRRRHPWTAYLWSAIVNSGNGGFFYWNYVSGSPDYDLVLVVRRAARAVEATYWLPRANRLVR